MATTGMLHLHQDRLFIHPDALASGGRLAVESVAGMPRNTHASQRIRNVGACDLVFLAVCTPRFTRDAYEAIDPEPM